MSQLHPWQNLQFGLLAADMAPKTSAAAKAKEEPQAQVRKVAKVHGKGKGKGRGKSAKSREEPSDCVKGLLQACYGGAVLPDPARLLAPPRRWTRGVRRVAAKQI